MGRPRKRQREEEDHTHTSEAGLDDSGELDDGEKSVDPRLAAIPSNVMGTLEYQSEVGRADTQNLQSAANDTEFNSLRDTDSFFSSIEVPSFAPTSSFLTWNPSRDPYTFSPMDSLNPVPLHPSSGLYDGAISNSTFDTIQGGCVCLGNLYSTLAAFQSLPAPSFPYPMGTLRKATRCGSEVVRCQLCPQA